MITYNQKTHLPSSVLVYKFIQAFIGSIILIAFTFFAPQLSPFRLILPIVTLLLSFGYTYLWWSLYRYEISSEAITIQSGVLFRSNKSVAFNDLQSAEVNTGPLLLMLGLGRFVAFTASPRQVVMNTSYNQNGRGGTSSTIRPDVDLIITKAEAEEVLTQTRKGDIQKVQAVGNPVVAETQVGQ